MKPIKKARRATRFSNEAATRLHGEANKSDPFATRRMSLHLANGYENANTVKESHGVADESLNIIRGRATEDGAMAGPLRQWLYKFGNVLTPRKAYKPARQFNSKPRELAVA